MGRLPAGSADVFAHITALDDSCEFDPEMNDRVSFEMGEVRDGRQKAVSFIILTKDDTAPSDLARGKHIADIKETLDTELGS
jgi:cold shock CspA family protein